jgi:integrase
MPKIAELMSSRQRLQSRNSQIDTSQRHTLERRGLKTFEEYERILRLYIEPHFRDAFARKLRPATAGDWVVTLMRSGGCAGKPISAKTAKHAFALLSRVLRWGVRQQIVAQNVCDAAEAPNRPRSKARALPPDEISKLVTQARSTRWETSVEAGMDVLAIVSNRCATE